MSSNGLQLAHLHRKLDPVTRSDPAPQTRFHDMSGCVCTFQNLTMFIWFVTICLFAQEITQESTFVSWHEPGVSALDHGLRRRARIYHSVSLQFLPIFAG